MPTDRTKVIQVYVTPDELERIRVAAAQAGESMSEYVRGTAFTPPIRITASDAQSLRIAPGSAIITPPGWKIDFEL